MRDGGDRLGPVGPAPAPLVAPDQRQRTGPHRVASPVAAGLARSAYRKEVHNTVLYAVAGVIAAIGVARPTAPGSARLAVLLGIPLAMTLVYGRRFLEEANLLEQRATLERRAEETLSQEELAPRRWAARLAPVDLPDFEGLEVGRAYEPGTGLMAGDFYDLYVHRAAAAGGGHRRRVRPRHRARRSPPSR